MAKNNNKRYNDVNELTYTRALFTTMVKELESYIDENRKGDREIIMVRSKGIKLKKGEYLVVTVKADLRSKTTTPYLDIIECDEDELESSIKELLAAISGTARNMLCRVLNDNPDDTITFKNELRLNFNYIAEDAQQNMDDAFENYDSLKDVITILGQIVKNAINDLDEAIDELDDDLKENFRRSRATIELENTTIKKKGRAFTFKSGIILDVFGFDDEDDSYEELTTSLGYEIKREVKNDSMYD